MTNFIRHKMNSNGILWYRTLNILSSIPLIIRHLPNELKKCHILYREGLKDLKAKLQKF